MLTADLVHARRRGGELRIVPLDKELRDRALALADALVLEAALHVGSTREELESALGAVDAGPREQRLRDGLAKLVLDRCTFDAQEALDPEATRREVFVRASALRFALAPGGRFERKAVLAEVAAARETTPEIVEASLFADLRSAHLLLSFEAISPALLVASYERAQAQAVLLRAVKVTVDVEGSPASLRALFRKLKFLRLLHTVERHEGGHRVLIDGPFSLFESVTKYGLQLAMLLPALEDCEAWKLVADIRWGKERTPLLFHVEGGAAAGTQTEMPMPGEIASFVQAFESLDSGWSVAPNGDILELPGVGLSIPDLVFSRGKAEKGKKGAKSEKVYFEVMGYWSRAAVWKRVELVQAGLASRILFAVSSRLRVSEEVLDGDLPGALYVYKGTMSARRVAEQLERLGS